MRQLCVLFILLWRDGGILGSEDPVRCSEGAERECEVQSKTPYTIKGRRYQYVNIECEEEGTVLECSRFPTEPFSNNGNISSLGFKRCDLDGPILCFLEKLGIHQVERVFLQYSRTPLTKDHVEGMYMLDTLRVVDRGYVTEIPYDVISYLPNLKEYRLNGANVTLNRGPLRANLTALELSSDSIPEIPSGAFQEVGSLTALSIWNNEIKTIYGDSFKGLSNLTLLSLNKNRLAQLPDQLLAPMPNLVTFLMQRNPLELISNSMFRGLDKLCNITISVVSPQKPLVLENLAFSNLASLKKLILDECYMESLPETVFSKSRSIEILSLKNNKLTELHPSVLKDQKNMKRLYLNKNILKSLSNSVFLNLESLVELDLSENLLEIFSDNLFSGLKSLKTLKANYNDLKHIGSSSFQGAPIQTLELGHNRLSFHQLVQQLDGQYVEVGYWCPFDSLISLRNLDLKYNGISVMCNTWLNVMMGLKTLDLSHNKFKQLTYADFNFLSDVTVDLSDNQISNIYIQQAIWDQMSTEAKVILKNNPFDCNCELYTFLTVIPNSKTFILDDVSCAQPKKLKGKLLSNLDLSKVVCEHRNCTSNCDCVEEPYRDRLSIHCSNLDYQFANLSDAYEAPDVKKSLKLDRAPQSFKNLRFQNVQEIDLSGLNLEHLTLNDLPDSVTYLNLSRNGLKYLPEEYLSQDLEFSLSNNPLACDCWHLEQMRNLVEFKAKIRDFDNLTCDDESFFTQKDVNSLCNVWIASTVGLSLTFFGVLCIFVAAALYKYSFEFKIYISKYFPCCIPEEAYDASKTYDVFISYAHQDEEFIKIKLLPKLEKQYGYKACVHYRDWLLGDTIPYNIAASVQDSRRTAIVLSKNFLNSIWGLMEFRAAHVQACREGRARVIIILLEDVTNHPNLDQEIKVYLTTNTYVKWEDPWFWDKFVYALPRRGRPVDKREEKRLQLAAEKIKEIKSGLDVQVNMEGQLVNAAFVKGEF